MRIFTIIFLIFCYSALANNNVPLAIEKNLSQAILIGKTKLRFIGFKVYDIALWSENNKFSYDKKFAIIINYNINFTKDGLIERSLNEIENLHQITPEEKATYISNLDRIFVNINKGDEKIAFFDPKKGVTLFYNEKKMGVISDLKFAKLFVDIWLDPKGSYPAVTKELLGQK